MVEPSSVATLFLLKVGGRWENRAKPLVFHSMMSGTAGSEIIEGVLSALRDGDYVVEF